MKTLIILIDTMLNKILKNSHIEKTVRIKLDIQKILKVINKALNIFIKLLVAVNIFAIISFILLSFIV